jgi:hypothetical protein
MPISENWELELGDEIHVFHPFQNVIGFGLSPAQERELRAMTPTSIAEISALLIDEDELASRGRWGGGSPPMRRRWFYGSLG